MSKKNTNSGVDSTVVSSGTVADGIWQEIKGKKLDMFSLPGQSVEAYFQPFPADPNKLHLNFSVSSSLPALEAALGPKFHVELVGKYIIVSRVE